MSTKTIALDLKVYQKLARMKSEGESFSRTIDRLVDRYPKAHTGADIIAGLDNAPPPLSEGEERQMEKLVEQQRRTDQWNLHDLS